MARFFLWVPPAGESFAGGITQLRQMIYDHVLHIGKTDEGALFAAVEEGFRPFFRAGLPRCLFQK